VIVENHHILIDKTIKGGAASHLSMLICRSQDRNH